MLRRHILLEKDLISYQDTSLTIFINTLGFYDENAGGDNILRGVKEYWDNRGFRQFVVRTGVFVGLFLIMPIIIFPLLEFSRYKGKTDPLPFFLVDIGAAFLFISMAFFFLARKKLKNIREFSYNKKDGVIFGFLTIVGLAGYLYLRYFTSHNVEYTWGHRPLFVILILFFLFISFLFLAFAVYGGRFIKYFLSQFKKEITISLLMVAVYYAITINLRKSWFFLGDFVAKSVAWLLSLSFENVVLKNKGIEYILGAEGFVARIGELCSGVDSMTLFLGLYILIFSLDWKKIDKKRMTIIFIPGLIGTIFINILRIYLLYLSGILISPDFAIGLFHSNAGWILFILYFMVFWYFAYPWVTGKKGKKRKNHIKKIVNKYQKDSLYRNSLFLMMNTIIMTALGFVFWMINTKLYSTEEIGLASTIISVMGLITSLSGLGLGMALIRFLPQSKRKNDKINSCFTVMSLFTIIISTIFLIGLAIFSPKLLFIKKNLIFSIIFIFFMVIMSIFTLIESVYIAYTQNKFILYKNTLFSLAKLIFPFFLVVMGSYGIFLSWTISGGIALIYSLIILGVKFGYKMKIIIYDEIIKKIFEFSFGNYIAGLFSISQILLLPLIITHYLTPKFTAYFYIDMMIAGLVFMIPQSISNSLFAHIAYNPQQMRKNVWKSIKLNLLLLIPAIILIVIFGKFLLMLFGEEYVINGYTVLVILVVSSVFISIKSIYLTVINIKREIGKLIMINFIMTAVVFILSFYFIHRGLIGISYAYLIGQISIIPLMLLLR